MRDVADLPLVLEGQIRLFADEPAKRPEASQWFTPHWLALRLALWVPRTAYVIEPACGSGNLIAALLECGHPADKILGIEMDAGWAEFTRKRFDGRVQIISQDFLQYGGSADVVLQNPPFEDAMHAAFISHALKLAPEVTGLYPVAIEFGGERARGLWKHEAQKVRRAILPDRVKYGGEYMAKFDSVAIKAKRRTSPRPINDQNVVIEETWLAA